MEGAGERGLQVCQFAVLGPSQIWVPGIWWAELAGDVPGEPVVGRFAVGVRHCDLRSPKNAGLQAPTPKTTNVNNHPSP